MPASRDEAVVASRFIGDSGLAGESAVSPGGAGGFSLPTRSGRSVLVDARGLHASGIGRYTREILKALFADPRFTRVKLLGEVEALRRFCDLSENGGKAVIYSYPFPYYSPAAQVGWLRLRARGMTEADVAFFPHYDAPFFALPARSVITVQDLTHFKVPAAFPLWRRLAAGILLRKVVTRAARILVSSQSTRRDLAERIPGSEAKTEITPFGVDTFFLAPAAKEAELDSSARVARPYLLCVGNRKPHKNLVAAVEAIARVAKEIPDVKLVIVGKVYPGWSEVLRRAEDLGVRDRVVDLPEVTDSELRRLYGNCEALLFLSLYEGFGLPVLEAMSCDAPVIASDRASIPEVVGDAGLLVDPNDYGAVADSVLRLFREPGLREELVRRGRERAATFTWARAARQTLNVLYETGGDRSQGRRPDGGSDVLRGRA